MLWLSNSQQFSFLGLFGLIVIILYILFIYTSVKNRKHNFKFSITVLLIYLILVLWMVSRFNNSITFTMQYWYQPFLLCIIVDGTIYLIKKYRSNKQ